MAHLGDKHSLKEPDEEESEHTMKLTAAYLGGTPDAVAAAAEQENQIPTNVAHVIPSTGTPSKCPLITNEDELSDEEDDYSQSGEEDHSHASHSGEEDEEYYYVEEGGCDLQLQLPLRHTITPSSALPGGLDGTVIAVGLPAVARRPSAVYSIPSSELTISPAVSAAPVTNQVLMDRYLAENLAQDQANLKGGKKGLPDEETHVIMRRHATTSCAWNNNKMAAIELTPFSPAKSAEFSMASLSPPGIVGDYQTSKSALVSPQPRRMIGDTNNRSIHSLERFIDEDTGEEIEAQAGISVASLPGAFFMGNSSHSFSNQASTGYDSGFDDEVSTVNTELAHASSGNHSSVATSPILPGTTPLPNQTSSDATYEAQLAQPERRIRVTGQVILQDEAALAEQQHKRWRFIQASTAFIIVVLIAIIAVVATVVPNNNKRSASLRNSPRIAWIMLGDALYGPPIDDEIFFGKSVSLSGNGERLVSGSPGIDAPDTASNNGQVQVFDLSEDNVWELKSTLDFEAQQGQAGDCLQICANGNRIIVASPTWSNEVGLVTVFEDDDDNHIWNKVGEDILGQENESGRFGTSVAISHAGDTIAVGAPFSSSEGTTKGGTVRLYRQVYSDWRQLGSDIVSDGNNTLLGSAVALSADGRRVAIGASNARQQQGHVIVYDLNDEDEWEQVGQVLLGAVSFESFGNAVSLDGDGGILAIGAFGSSGSDNRFESGKVQVFQFNNETATWEQLGVDILGQDSEQLGTSVALAANRTTVAIGSPGQGDMGRVKVYFYDETFGWVRLDDDELQSDSESFGSSTAISSDGTIVAVGAPNADFDGRLNKVGSVYAYRNTMPPEDLSSATTALTLAARNMSK